MLIAHLSLNHHVSSWHWVFQSMLTAHLSLNHPVSSRHWVFQSMLTAHLSLNRPVSSYHWVFQSMLTAHLSLNHPVSSQPLHSFNETFPPDQIHILHPLTLLKRWSAAAYIRLFFNYAVISFIDLASYSCSLYFYRKKYRISSKIGRSSKISRIENKPKNIRKHKKNRPTSKISRDAVKPLHCTFL